MDKESYNSETLLDADGKTELYKLCADEFSPSKAEKLLDSYSLEIKKAVVNQQVEMPQRFKSLDARKFDFSGYNIGDTPLHAAVRTRKTSTIEKLLRAGARSNIINLDNKTPLDIAREDLGNKDIKKIIKLLERAQTTKIVETRSSPTIIQRAMSYIRQQRNVPRSPTGIAEAKSLSSLSSFSEENNYVSRGPTPMPNFDTSSSEFIGNRSSSDSLIPGSSPAITGGRKNSRDK